MVEFASGYPAFPSGCTCFRPTPIQHSVQPNLIDQITSATLEPDEAGMNFVVCSIGTGRSSKNSRKLTNLLDRERSSLFQISGARKLIHFYSMIWHQYLGSKLRLEVNAQTYHLAEGRLIHIVISYYCTLRSMRIKTDLQTWPEFRHLPADRKYWYL